MKPLRTILVGACAAGLLVTSLAASAVPSAPSTAAPAAKQYTASVRFLGFDRVRAYGSTTHLRGQIVVPALSEAIQGLHVKLYRQFDGRSHWSYLGRGSTHGAHAEFRFSVRSRANASYRIVFAGNHSVHSTDGSTSVDVYRVFDAALEDGSGRFHGRISPHYADHRVYLDRRHCGACSWHRLKTGHTDSRAHFSFHTDAPRRGKFYWRVSTPATTKYIRSYSSVFTTQLR